jgi:hypothetical protein
MNRRAFIGVIAGGRIARDQDHARSVGEPFTTREVYRNEWTI